MLMANTNKHGDRVAHSLMRLYVSVTRSKPRVARSTTAAARAAQEVWGPAVLVKEGFVVAAVSAAAEASPPDVPGDSRLENGLAAARIVLAAAGSGRQAGLTALAFVQLKFVPHLKQFMLLHPAFFSMRT